MSTTTVDAPAVVTAPQRAPIPATRLVSVELQKMFDTRSGFWLVTGGAIAAALATLATILFAPHEAFRYSTFAAAIGAPLSVVLPMMGVLSVTSEWTQRTGLSTFTMVPHRGRVIAAKLAATLLVGIGSIAVAMTVGAVGNVAGSSLAGVPIRWDSSVADLAHVVLADALGMLMGFTLGVVIRNSSGAIVSYFVYALVLPAIFGTLANFQSWFADIQGWVDFRFSTTALYADHVSATDWAHLAVSGILWLVIPLAIGLRLLMRSEVK